MKKLQKGFEPEVGVADMTTKCGINIVSKNVILCYN